MKVYRIVSSSILVCLFLWGIIFGIVMTDVMYGWNYTAYESYNGDAYTDIQQATADAANNVSDLHSDLGLYGGMIVMLACTIGLFITVEKLVAAIIDCAKSAAEKRRRREEELQRQYAEQVKNIGATDGVFYPNNERL